MRSKLLIASMALALSTSVAGSARAVMIAGWDFSQYAIDGFITVDGENLTDTLPANYSSLDPTFGAGAESAAFGRLYLNGQFGSDATPLDFTDSLVPSAANPGSLSSNLLGPVSAGGGVPFDTFNVLDAEGQGAENPFTLAKIAGSGTQRAVFSADLTSVLEIGTEWSLSFGGRTLDPGTTSSIGVEYSVDGSSYLSAGSAALTSVDTLFNFGFGPLLSDTLFVRLSFDGVNAQPQIDNLIIDAATQVVPEPGTLLLVTAGLAGLAVSGRREA
jgi:hypothetical protein